jgi:hypothetical protein
MPTSLPLAHRPAALPEHLLVPRRFLIADAEELLLPGAVVSFTYGVGGDVEVLRARVRAVRADMVALTDVVRAH